MQGPCSSFSNVYEQPILSILGNAWSGYRALFFSLPLSPFLSPYAALIIQLLYTCGVSTLDGTVDLPKTWRRFNDIWEPQFHNTRCSCVGWALGERNKG